MNPGIEIDGAASAFTVEDPTFTTEGLDVIIETEANRHKGDDSRTRIVLTDNTLNEEIGRIEIRGDAEASTLCDALYRIWRDFDSCMDGDSAFYNHNNDQIEMYDGTNR